MKQGGVAVEEGEGRSWDGKGSGGSVGSGEGGVVKRFRVWLLQVALLALWLPAAAFEAPPLTGRVVDQAGVLKEADRRRIELAIVEFEQASGGQLVVAFLNSIGKTPIEEVGLALAEAWTIGHRGRDDGVILIVVPAERRLRLEVGRGREQTVDAARAGEVIRSLQPFFRGGDNAGGAIYAVRRLQELVTGKAPAELPEPPEPSLSRQKVGQLAWLLFLCGVLAWLGFKRIGRGFRSWGGWGGRGGGGDDDDFGGGGFRGGGGGFGGGGASGRW